MSITKQKLGELWENATSLSPDGPLHQAIIEEYDDACAPTWEEQDIDRCTQAIIEDVQQFYSALLEYLVQQEKLSGAERRRTP
jgi:hypothetical protein